MLKKSAVLFISFFVLSVFILQFPRVQAVQDNAIQVVKFSENFDSVTAPSIPNGWTVSSTGTGSGFVTTSVLPDSAPNAIFTPSPATTSSATLTSPSIFITGATTVLNFRHRYQMETTWDGGVLEISVNGGNFQDILGAGGTFLTGGYTHDLNASTNPISSRRAWSGATPGVYISTSVRLAANTFGQNVRFRWIFGSNDSFAVEGWRIDNITVETVPTAANSNPIAISNVGTANPYPSGIPVAGLNGFVTGISVSLENFSHDAPDDVDILLVAPNGRRMILMSDVGGTTPVSDIDLTFSDTANAFLPDNSPLSTGVFKPTDFENNDTFPSPAPQDTPLNSTLGGFVGVNPNGNWQLFIVDDNGNNAGTISGGWSLDIQSSPTACLFSLSPTIQAFSASGGNGSFQINIPAGCGWTASTTANFVSFSSPTSGENTSQINFSVAQNLGAARTGLISITDTITTRTFQIQQGSGCPFALSQTTKVFRLRAAMETSP